MRQIMIGRRQALDAAWVEQASRAAQDRAASLPEFARASVVACYLALRGEVRTDLMMERCWEAGRTVCVPAFREELGSYGFCLLKRGEPLGRGALGVAEPERRQWMPPGEIQVAVTPGVAFDARGGRLGRGGGHYDRLLVGAGAGRPAFALGLAFDFQVVDRVPLDAHDARVDAVVTETRTVRCAAGAL